MKKIIRRYSSTMHGAYGRMGIRYGMIMGALMCIGLLVQFMIAKPASSPVSLVDNIIMLVVMIACCFLYRNSLEEKKVSFKEIWLLGFISGVVASLIFGMFMYVYVVWIDDQMQMRCAEVLHRVEDYKDYSFEVLKQMTSPSTIALQAIFYNVIMSILWAFVAGILVRNEKAEKK